MKSTRFLRSFGLGAVALALSLTTGCRKQEDSAYPDDLPPESTASTETTIIQEIYIETEEAAPATEEVPNLVGYETLSDGERVQVVTYVHSYPEAVETFPRVYWGGRWYYNVHGNFVFYSPYYSTWCYYWGPPVPLVYAWNYYYPWTPYYWGVGFYGPGYYWGGVGYYGYHGYGVAPASYRPPRGYMASKGGPSRGSASAGGPGRAASPGGPAGTGRHATPGGARGELTGRRRERATDRPLQRALRPHRQGHPQRRRDLDDRRRAGGQRAAAAAPLVVLRQHREQPRAQRRPDRPRPRPEQRAGPRLPRADRTQGPLHAGLVHRAGQRRR
ncbi:MAG: hypothetical protein H6711_21865 [Myxococcales bacterium]|nr:hypothetical protein [Myxococcales bacterium]